MPEPGAIFVNGMFPLLSDGMVIELLIRLSLGAIASFFAIIAWTRTRSISWMFVIAGILASYVGTLYRALRSFGLFAGPDILIFGAALGNIISDNISMCCFIVACVFYICSKK